MAEIEVPVFCYWYGCIEDGPAGIYYEGSTLKMITVKRKTELSILLDQLYLITGLDRRIAKFDIIGRYPSSVEEWKVYYIPFPVVNDTSLEAMLEVPTKYPGIKSVELYLEVKSTSNGVIDPAACSSQPLANPGSSLKRQRTDVFVKLERETDRNLGSDGLVHLVDLTGDSSTSNKDSNSGVSKPCMSSLWLDDHDLRVGLCFKDGDELKKAVDWCSLKGQQKCIVRETAKGEYNFNCIRWKCKWSLGAVKMEKHGLFEIIRYTGPHTCRPIDPEELKSEFKADEIERVVRVQPTLTIAELKKWWKKNFGYKLETSELLDAKEKAIKRVFGDSDQSFEDFPKLMFAFCSSNGLLVDWKYNLFPNPKFASFCGVFWAFSQSTEGFQHCRPLIIVDTKNLNGECQLKLMIASGVDAANNYFPLAFAITKEVSTDSWRWFLTGIREKVTQREGLCLISSPHPDIVAAIKESGSQWQEPWAYHRFCLNHLCSQFSLVFPSCYLKSLVKQAGCTSQKKEFVSYMKKIEQDNPDARKWLDQIPQNQWALVHDSGQRYGIMEINTKALFAVCERFGLADHVVTGFVLLLFDELRSSFEKSLSCSRASLSCGDVYTEPVMNKLEEFRTSSITYIVMPLDNNAFQVVASLSQKDEWIVQLSDCTCTCGEFQSSKFPCLHTLVVCKKLKFNPLQYVDDCYTLERLNKTYAATFNPVPEISGWPEASGVPRLFPPVISPPTPPSAPPPTPPSAPPTTPASPPPPSNVSKRKTAPHTTTVSEKPQQIKESSFSKADDVNKIELNKEIFLNFEEKQQESEVQRLLEAEKRRLLAEIELGSIFEKRVDVDNDVDKRSVKIELIDDTVLVNVVSKRPGSAYTDKELPRKHKKIEVKAKVSDFHSCGENNREKFRRLYSRKQLESMRFAHIVNQRKVWSEMYGKLLSVVVTEYESLVCLKNHKTSKSNRGKGKTESGIGENLGTEDNDDYNSILKPAFAVDGEPDFSTGPPEDGLEYLRRVRWESKGFPNVKVAKIDESNYIKKEQSVYMPQIPEIPECPEYLLPVKEWEDLLLSDFLHLRQAISQNADSCEDEIISNQSVEDLLIEIFNKHLHIESDESFGGMVSEIQGMDSVTRISKLKKRIYLVEKENGIESSDCKWVVALCASLDTPLDADTSACLRALLRKCASVRAEKSLKAGDEEVITMANILITIAGRYFGQMGQ